MMLEFRLNDEETLCELKQIIRGFGHDKVDVFFHILEDKQFTSLYHKEHHQHKIDELINHSKMTGIKQSNLVYVSGDPSMRGNGIHEEER